MITFNRHDLVWLKLDAVTRAEYAGPAPMEPISALSLLHRWVLGDYPLIVTRQDDVPANWVRVGLAEPASWGKKRLSFLVGVDDLQKHQRGPALEATLSSLPQPWQAPAAQLNAFLKTNEIAAHVYGSAAINVLTGLPCITENSDLDVLFLPSCWADAQRLCSYLHTLQTEHPAFKVDGEVVNPRGEAVQWRELQQAREQLLIKRNHGVDLLGLSQYQHAFEPTIRTST